MAEESHTHVVPPRVYVAIFLALMALTALTTWVAYIDLGAMNVVIMLAIAGFKASLVVLWFMHLRYESHLTKVTILGSVFWLLVLILISASDTFIRWRPESVAELGLNPEAPSPLSPTNAYTPSVSAPAAPTH
jgi:cytochrome c oxidase subunit 4